MLPKKDQTEKSQRTDEDKKQSLKKPLSEEEIQQKQALEEYQKLGPDNDNSVDIVQKP